MHQFTIGIEEEYQIIDLESRDLVSHVSKIIEGGKAVLSENLKHEMHESMIIYLAYGTHDIASDLNDIIPLYFIRENNKSLFKK